MGALLLAFLTAGLAAGELPGDAEIERLVLENFKEPPLSAGQKEAVRRFVRDADPADKLLLPDFLRQHLDEGAKARFLKAAPERSKASEEFYTRAVAGLNAALGDRGYALPLAPLSEPDPLPPELDTPHLRLRARASAAADPRERVRLYTEALAVIGELDLRLSSALTHYDRAVAYFELRRPELAFDDLTQDLILYPGHADGLYSHAVAASYVGRWGEAVRSASALIELYPTLAIAYALRGSGRSELKDHAGALSDFNRAVELAPAEFWARLARGGELGLRGRPADAVDDFRAAIGLSSASALGYGGLAFAYLDLGRPEEAEKAFNDALRFDPTDPSLHAGLAVSHLRRGDNATAVRAYERAVALEPLFKETAASVMLKGRRWYKTPEGPESMEYYRYSAKTAAGIDELIGLRR